MTKQETILKGVAISEGIAIGSVFLLSPHDKKVPEFSISSHEVDEQISKYRSALLSSREDLKCLQQHRPDPATVAIIDSHICLLEDPVLVEQTEERIRHTLQNPASAFQAVIDDYSTRFSQ